MGLFKIDLRKTFGVYDLERKLRETGVSDLLAGPVRQQVKDSLSKLEPEKIRALADIVGEVADAVADAKK